jgi:hypothetical protein
LFLYAHLVSLHEQLVPDINQKLARVVSTLRWRQIAQTLLGSCPSLSKDFLQGQHAKESLVL